MVFVGGGGGGAGEAGVLAGGDACAPGHFLMVRPGDRTSLKVVGCITKKPTHGSSSARNASQQPEAV